MAKNSKTAPKPKKKPAKPLPPTGENDNISAAINEYVPENLRGSDRFLDLVNWNIRYFIAEGAVDAVATALNDSGAGFYKNAYGRTGATQRVAFMHDTEWVRTQEDFTALFARISDHMPVVSRFYFIDLD